MDYFAKTRFECSCPFRWHWLYVKSNTAPSKITSVRYLCLDSRDSSGNNGCYHITKGLDWSNYPLETDKTIIKAEIIQDN